MSRSVPLYSRLANALLTEISKGQLRRGDRLPTEDELIEVHGVSRITVRQALEVLRQRGLIERIPGRGSFVSRPPEATAWTIESVEDVLQIVGAETDLKVLEWKSVRTTPAVERRLGVSGERVYVLRGLRSRRGGLPLCYTETYTPLKIGRQIRGENLVTSTVLEVIEGKLGLQVQDGTEEISSGVADRVLARRLGVPAGSPVLILELTFFDLDKRPLEYAKAWYRADQFTRRNKLARIR
jgi:GntR family transcriptional regulator